MNHLLDLIRLAEDRHAISRLVDVFLANQTDRSQTDLGFSVQPLAELFGAATRADEQRFVFGSKNPAGEDRRQIIMREQKRDVKPGHKVEKEDTRNERVLRCDQINYEQTDTGNGLAK